MLPPSKLGGEHRQCKIMLPPSKLGGEHRQCKIMLPPSKHLLLSEVFPPKTGGSGRWFWEIYRRLPRERIVVAAGEDPRQAAFDCTHNLRLVRLPLSPPTWGVASVQGFKAYWRTAARLRRLVAAERVGMLHCGKCLPEGLVAWIINCWQGVPYLCYVHGEELKAALSSRELTWLTRRVLRSAEFVIANSRNTQRILMEEWSLESDRIRLLHPGVDTTRFVPAASQASIRAQLGWWDRSILLTVGRLQKRKGHDQMILALSAIRKAIPDVLYAIVGDGEELQSLKRLVERTGMADHVQFRGEPDDEELVRCYQQCDLFVLPNREVGKDIEGFGMVLLEAQACGKPVVAGASGGTAETMQIPQTGYVVPCDTPDQLGTLVIRLLKDSEMRRQMGAAARQWVVERFDWQSLVQQAAQMFRLNRLPVDNPSDGAQCTRQKPVMVCGQASDAAR